MIGPSSTSSDSRLVPPLAPGREESEFRLSAGNAVLIWLFFLSICFGLGYPTLNRYDPSKVPGLSDAEVYCNIVRGAKVPPVDISHRLLVPWVARPFYWLAGGRVGSWNPALFAMLVSNAMFTASTALGIVMIGLQCSLSYTTSLLGAMLFLLNFAVSNLTLAGYVDSGEALFLTLLTWSLLSARWFLLPVWAIPGSLAKETFAPFALTFAIIWWLTERPFRAARLPWIFGLAIFAFGTVWLALSTVHGSNFGPLNFAEEMDRHFEVGFSKGLLNSLTAREFWYIFVWLMPLGLLSLDQMDRRWSSATGATFLLALLFGAYNNGAGNTARALFNIAGPLLGLSASVRLTANRPSKRAGSPIKA
jgi:hypothetical protein